MLCLTSRYSDSSKIAARCNPIPSSRHYPLPPLLITTCMAYPTFRLTVPLAPSTADGLHLLLLLLLLSFSIFFLFLPLSLLFTLSLVTFYSLAMVAPPRPPSFLRATARQREFPRSAAATNTVSKLRTIC